jgi:hypothetical protein
MKGFGLKESTTEKNCSNCAMSEGHLVRGLLCKYTDKPAKDCEKCGLYLPKRTESNSEETQNELF